MYLINRDRLKSYLLEDRVSAWIDSYSDTRDEELVCQQWLRQSEPKRMIFNNLYGELFDTNNTFNVLDVGGGLTGLTLELARRHHYVLVDLFAHGGFVDNRIRESGFLSSYSVDWINFNPSNYDLIIANDLFPNVDQRLELFLDRFLPYARRIRLALTYYDKPKYYVTRRVDADEIMSVLAWDGRFLSLVMEKYSDRIENADFSIFSQENESIYPNGRQVCLVELKGDLDNARR